jgi:primosomal protein N' (replication factor Y)
MTVHSMPPRLHCHHCDYSLRLPDSCSYCGSATLDNRGFGTEQIEDQLGKIFPDTTLVRIDRDSTRHKGALSKALAQVRNDDACLLIGTQMLAKGHHFANLDLVVVVDGDQGFLNPDFRAMERNAQLLLQVAGRAGRESQSGKVIIQTHRPDHPALLTLTQRGYGQFALEQLSIRREARLPPYWHCAIFRAESKRADNAQQFLRSLQQKALSYTAQSDTFAITGPVPNQLEKINERYRFQLLLRSNTRSQLRQLLDELMLFIEGQALAKRVRWHLDIDPMETS